jgi:glycosyltransferase involved in cell wall biosynthesis
LFLTSRSGQYSYNDLKMPDVRLSVIVATRNRAHALGPCLDSIAAAFARAAPIEAEIVVVDNGSTDNTPEIIRAWAGNNHVAIQSLAELRPGKASALNSALHVARGELLAFIDDDCRLHTEYVNDLLRHAAADTEPVLRGGRIDLGDPTDLPLTIKTDPEPMQWSRRRNSARHQPIAGQINGCNMTMPRAIVQTLGPFDKRFGPGTAMKAGDDTDYLFRAYLADFLLEYVPDMRVAHYHGRKTPADGRRLLQGYLISNGAEYAKHGWKHPNLCRPFLWDCKNALKEIFAGGISTTSIEYFSHRDKVVYAVQGAIRYLTKAAGRPEVETA